MVSVTFFQVDTGTQVTQRRRTPSNPQGPLRLLQTPAPHHNLQSDVRQVLRHPGQVLLRRFGGLRSGYRDPALPREQLRGHSDRMRDGPWRLHGPDDYHHVNRSGPQAKLHAGKGPSQ